MRKLLLTSLVLGLFACSNPSSNYKVGFVKTQELVYQYEGMKEAHEAYKNKRTELESGLKEEQDRLNQMYQDYQTNKSTWSETKIQQTEMQMQTLQYQLQGQQQKVEEEAAAYDQSLTDGVLKQIEAKVKEFAEREGYDIIHGTSNGEVLYGKESMDLTDEILKELNTTYKK